MFWIFSGKMSYADLEKRYHEASDLYNEMALQARMLRNQVSHQEKYIKELKRRNPDGTFKPEDTDFLTR